MVNATNLFSNPTGNNNINIQNNSNGSIFGQNINMNSNINNNNGSLNNFTNQQGSLFGNLDNVPKVTN